MNYGLYLSASGVLTNSYRQDVLANNLANMETVGFKRDIPAIRQREAQGVEHPGSAFRNRLLEKLGGGSLAGEQKISFAPAPLKAGGPLDVALEGENAFFAVKARDPRSGEQTIQLTRDGRLGRDSQGRLINAGGDLLLDPNDQPIQISNGGPVEIDPVGRIHQNGEVVGQLQITGVASTNVLHKQGQNLFAWDGKADPRRPAKVASVRPGFVETSGVDPVRALMEMVDATKAATSNANLVRYHDLLMDRAVNSLGRVA